MNQFPHGWGRPRDDVYGAYDSSYLNDSQPVSHTQRPIVTGTSVLGVKFKDGVIIAADNIASYGSLARYNNVERLLQVGTHTVVGAGGDISDMQYLHLLLDNLLIKEQYPADDHNLYAPQVHTYISRVLYQRRNKFDPLWNSILTAGADPKTSEPFLSYVDLKGTTYSAPALATGYGAHLAIPILRKHVPDEEAVSSLSQEEAQKLVEECMKVLWYRDARSGVNYSWAIITKDGVTTGNKEIENQSWKFAEMIKGYGAQNI
ncbi:Proteasome subunit beta type-7 [Orbilia javanica]|uniref:Proteasome subunit beta n=1 Tax=Orbilia javanica TaxID=47235 RepID=A0AAN8N4E3_9PEZI